MMTEDLAAMTAAVRELDPGTPVPLPPISRAVGWSPDAQMYAISSGAVSPLPIPPAGRRGYLVSRDEALTILAVAILALAAGFSIVTMLRAVKATGLDVGQLVPGQPG
jgi:hypothetical protein